MRKAKKPNKNKKNSSYRNLAREIERENREKEKLKRKRKKELAFPLRSINEREAEERGFLSEKRFKEALEVLKMHGILYYEKSAKHSKDDKIGIDFKIWGKEPYKCYFTVDVTSSMMTGLVDKAEKYNRHTYRDNHHIFVVSPSYSNGRILNHLIELFAYESGSDKNKINRIVAS